MEPRFNLINEPWIPVITKKGDYEKLGLKDTILNSHELLEVYDPSPIVTASLYRLLLAILHRVYGPTSVKQWKEYYKSGRWNKDPLEEYFEKWYDRFYLVQEKYPFYQYPKLKDEVPIANPISQIRYEISSGNNPTLFDHSHDDTPEPLTLDKVCLHLIAFQSYALAGGNSQPFYFMDAPLSRYATLFIIGESLFYTLIFNLVVLDEYITRIRGTGSDNDIPYWEEECLNFEPERSYVPKGYINYLTFPSRRILLIPDSSTKPITVKYVYLRQGHNLSENVRAPFTPYSNRGPLRFQIDRLIWRDLESWIGFEEHYEYNPININNLRKFIEITKNFKVQLFGFITQPGKQKIEQWFRTKVPCPKEYLINGNIVNTLKQCLNMAEDVSKILSQATKAFIKKLSTDKESGVLFPHFNPQPFYWSALEPEFFKTMDEIAKLEDIDPEQKAEKSWALTVFDTALDAFETTTRSLDNSAKVLKAVTEARQYLRNYLLSEKKSPLKSHISYIKEVKEWKKKERKSGS